MLVPTYDLLHAAQQGGYALGAFNVYNLEGACSVVNAAEQNNSPAMLQIHPAALSYAGTALHRRACVCIGNVQGHYHCEPNLDFERLALLSERVNVPLVLHGTSGLPEGMVHASIRRGIVKLNVNTEIRQAFLGSMRERFMQDPPPDFVDLLEGAVEAMTQVVADKLHLFGSVNKA